ncbi:MAG: helix-turn-helix domain-containing protein [Propionibacteriales bacterium]|nr:helix-turn-helix domain-containing protein [Propionibacteriales bacterium]
MTDDDSTDGSSVSRQSGAPTARRMVLGAQLRRLREAAEISRADAAYTIRASESKMSRLERGRVGFKERDVEDLLTLYAVSDPDERAVFLELARTANQPGWWHRYSDVIPDWFNDYVGLEESVSRIQSYEHQFVPGLLQTEEYARAIMTHGRPETSDDEVERRLSVRRRRQRLLARPGAPQFWAVIDESVLYRPIGGHRVLKDQLRSLLEVTRMSHIALQILSYEHSTSSAEGAFTVLRFPEGELPTIVYVEHLTGAIYLDRLDEVEVYGRCLDRLAVEAKTPEESRQLLLKLVADR